MDKNFLLLIGQKMKQVRTERKLTQEYLAEKIEVHPTYVGKIESGKSNISMMLLFKISRALEIKLSDFFDFDE